MLKNIFYCFFWFFAFPAWALDYAEQLAVHRMKFPLQVPLVRQETVQEDVGEDCPLQEDVKEALALLLEQRKAWQQQQEHLTSATYTLQVYLGTSRAQAEGAFKRLKCYLVDCEPEIRYQLSRYVVFVGHFLTRIEAYPYYARIKQKREPVIIRPMPTLNQPDRVTMPLKNRLEDHSTVMSNEVR